MPTAVLETTLANAELNVYSIDAHVQCQSWRKDATQALHGARATNNGKQAESCHGGPQDRRLWDVEDIEEKTGR
jgi:hypothetical protein